MRYLLTLFTLIYACTLSAQEGRIPFMECHYVEKYIRNLKKPKRITQDEMVLSIARECSEYFSLWQRVRQALTDSIFSRGGTLADWYAARENFPYPSSTQKEVIYNHLPKQGRFTHINKISTDWYIYEEDIVSPEWDIKEEAKTVAGYPCQRAEVDFLGRHWIVWFTQDIPISLGPWKLNGLPGLILEAMDENNEYHFTCMEIKNVSEGKPIAIPKKKYIRCSKKDFIDTHLLYKKDMNAYLKRQGKPLDMVVRKDGSIVPIPPRNYDYNYIERLPED